jgi:D-sedoheptulose 7-phosphate isomerase
MTTNQEVETTLAEGLLEARAREHTELLEDLSGPAKVRALAIAAETIVQSLNSGGTIYFCGNGGSAAEAQHLVAEFVGRYRAERRPLAAVALGSTQSVSSALANDYGYAEAGLARELEALSRRGDVLVALSTSGRSPNVLAALEFARANGVATILMTGQSHHADGLADALLVVESTTVAVIQEMHAVLGHVICELVEQQMGFDR